MPLKLKMNGVHEYLLAVQIDLIKLNLVDWRSIYSNSVEYKKFKERFLKHFSEFTLNVGRDDLLDLMLENGARVNVKKKRIS